MASLIHSSNLLVDKVASWLQGLTESHKQVRDLPEVLSNVAIALESAVVSLAFDWWKITKVILPWMDFKLEDFKHFDAQTRNDTLATHPPTFFSVSLVSQTGV